MSAAPSMAEVLAEHAYGAGSQGRYCKCGAMGVGDRQTNHTAHVAQALAAAGFGHVASVERERDLAIRTANVSADFRAAAAEAQVAAVRDVLAEHWDWKAGRVLHAAVLAALDGEATP